MRVSIPVVLSSLALAIAAARGADPVLVWDVGPGTSGALVEDHRAPIVMVRIDFGAGTWMPWFRESHAAEAFEIQAHDAAGRLRREADRLAIDLSLAAGSRSSTLWISCLKEDLPQGLRLVREVLANRDFDRNELRRWKRTSKIAWETSLKEPQFVLRQAGARLLFAEGDPRRRPYEKPEPIVTDTERLARVRDLLIRLPGRVIGFAGDLTRDEAERLASTLLPPIADAIPTGLEPDVGAIVAEDARPPEVTLALPRLTQVYFAYGRESLSYRDPRYAASMIADHVLGGHFNSRLMVALRQEGGETYGAGVYDGGGFDVGPYALGTFTRTENAVRTDVKLREVLRMFHEAGITEDERAAAAGNAVGSRAFARESPGRILGEFLWERRLGLPRGFLDDLAERAAALPLEEVNAFIREFHDPARFTMITLSTDGD